MNEAKRFTVLVDGIGRLHVRPAGQDGSSRIGEGHYRHTPGGNWQELVCVNAPMTSENVRAAYAAILRVENV